MIKQLVRKILGTPRKIRWQLFFSNVEIDSSAQVVLSQIRGMNKQSTLKIGSQSLCNAIISFDRPEAEVVIGDRTFIGKSTLVSATGITIGNDVLISWGATIVDHDSHHIEFEFRNDDVVEWGKGRKDWTHVAMGNVTVGDKVWIGFNVIILKGVTIGEGAVIAAGSIVTKDVPAWSVAAGVPAKVVKTLKPGE